MPNISASAVGGPVMCGLADMRGGLPDVGRGRTAWDVDIDWYDAITASGDAVGVVVVASSVGAASHADDPSWLGHLIIDLSQCGSHLVRKRARHDHNVALPWGGSEDDPQSVLVVPRGRQVHHFDGAAGESEGHGPQG